MVLTQQQIKDKLIFLEKGDSYKSINPETGKIITVDVTEEFTSEQKTTIRGYIRTLAKVFYGMIIDYFILICADKNNGN